MALFRRRTKTEELLEVHVALETWANRLGRVGSALDCLQNEVRDVVVIAEGDETARGEVISLLGYRQSTFVAGWTSLMYRLSSNRDALVLIGTDGATPLLDSSASTKWWKLMTGVGTLLDAIPSQISSPSVVFLPSGVVVNAMTAEFGLASQYRLRSFALSNEQIAGALQHETGMDGFASRPAVRSI